MQLSSNNVRVLFFGSFDPLHDGHRNAFIQARSLGDFLIVIVARDSTIVRDKGRNPSILEQARLTAVAGDMHVDAAMLGDSDAKSYAILHSVPFNILALGYDQKPSDIDARRILDENNLEHVSIVRLDAFQPELYKSSLLREG